MQETIATAYGLFVRLCRRRKSALVYATPLAQFAIKKVRAGRRIGSRGNSRDVMSPRARVAKGFTIERLDRFNWRTGQWREALVEDRTAGPAEIAETRIDFASWLSTLSNRDRQLAENIGPSAKRLDVWPACSGFPRRGSASCAAIFVKAGTGSWASWRRSVATA